MAFALWCIVIGLVVGVVTFLTKDLFVNASDARNPLRSLMVGISYGGVAIAAYGVALIVVQLWPR